jgi:transcriptional regulator with XRE-family HTH domain
MAQADLARLGSELRIGRVGAGLSQSEVGRLVGLSASQISRIERGLVRSVSVERLARIGSAVGLDVRIRAYPSGDPVRNAGHLRLIERLIDRIHPRVSIRLEVPLPIVGDRRAWDVWLAGLIDNDGRIRALPSEAETRIADAQAQFRRITLKMRDAEAEAVLVVIADTPSNRSAIASAGGAISGMFPVSSRKALAALAEGRYPGGSSLVFL